MTEEMLKYGAIAAAALVVAWPYLAKVLGSLKLPVAKPVDDMVVVLSLAKRLQEQGNTDAVALCQQLIDAMLSPQKQVKK